MTPPLKVLCVDDNEDAAHTAAVILSLVGCRVRVATNGETALAEATVIHPDVCVLDLNMPGMDGYRLARCLRTQDNDHPMKLIALTGMWDIDAQHRSHNAGFDEFLVKPADPRRLIELVTGKTEAELERDDCPQDGSIPTSSA